MQVFHLVHWYNNNDNVGQVFGDQYTDLLLPPISVNESVISVFLLLKTIIAAFYLMSITWH